MVSSKGKPTDPKLKEKVTEEVKQQPNKDGSGKGQMAAWKAAKIGKEYEAQGGDYEDTPGSKNKPKKGPPEKKGSGKTCSQRKNNSNDTNKSQEDSDKTETEGSSDQGKAKSKSKDENQSDGKEKTGRPVKSGGGASKAKEKKGPKEGSRRSARQAEAGKGVKRKSEAGDAEKSDATKAKASKKSNA